MTVADLQTLFDYNYWANRKLFAVIGTLPDDQFTRSVAGSYGSVRNTLVHVLSAEAGWLDRCGGPKRGPRLNPEDFPTRASVAAAWARVETELRAFLATLQDEDLGRIVEFSFDPSVKRAMPIGALLQHAATHAVHHRGQVALLLRVLGCTPGNFDILIYHAEKRGEPVL